MSLPKAMLTNFVASLNSVKMLELNEALGVALGIDL